MTTRDFPHQDVKSPGDPSMFEGGDHPQESPEAIWHCHEVKRAYGSSMFESWEKAQGSPTGRMARLAREPGYSHTRQLLARRRRSRARLLELLFILDLLLSVGAVTLVCLLWPSIMRLWPIGSAMPSVGIPDKVTLILLILLVWPSIFSAMGLYHPRWTNNQFDHGQLLRAELVAGIVAAGVLFVLGIEGTHWVLITFVAFDAPLLIAIRLLVRPLGRQRGTLRRVLIVGTGHLALDAARMVKSRRNLELVGVIGLAHELPPEPGIPDGWREAMLRTWAAWRLGELGDAPFIVSHHEVDLVLIALPAQERLGTSWVLSSLAHLPVHVYVLPDVVTETAKSAVDVVDGIPVIGLTESAISGWNARTKRIMDLAISIPAVIILAPLMLLIALVIRWDSKGPSIFRQERVGQHNRRFIIYKFRTMYVDADLHVQKAATQRKKGKVHKRRGDPRITRFGTLLRRSSLDELPQLFNIIKGDMSLVGPRPELTEIVEHYRSWQYRRLLVPQGLTGWWQVNGRSDRLLHLHTQDDIYYVRNYSLWLDIKIMLKTIRAVIEGIGAF